HFFGTHSQANYTKCIIEESKGNTQGAISCIKQSLQSGYSPAKAAKLNKLQKGISNGDIAWNFPKPADALGLEKLAVQRPAFYFSVKESLMLQPKWAAFRTTCITKMLDMQGEASKRGVAAANSMMKQVNGGSAGKSGKISATNLFLSRKARDMLSAVNREEAEFNQRMEQKARKQCEDLVAASRQLSLAIAAINQKYNKQKQEKEEADGNKYDKSEGDNSHSEQLSKQYSERACQEAKALVDAYYLHYNRLLSDLAQEWVSHELHYTNDIVYYSKYAITDDNEYQAAKLTAIANFISILGDNGFTSPVDFYPGVSGIATRSLGCKDPVEKPGSMKLQDYDEVHCDNHITLRSPFGVSHWDCNTETDTA
ncbi:MAG TPA: hypothetical protein VLD19_00390, partial [Chitinophagaceae bacterium]|nr:hypothetical protein [Chitinophagaceae bacterium]